MSRSHSYPSGKAKEKEEYSESKRYNSFPSPSSSSPFLGLVSSTNRLFGKGGSVCQGETASRERDEATHQTPLRVILLSKEGGVYTVK